MKKILKGALTALLLAGLIFTGCDSNPTPETPSDNGGQQNTEQTDKPVSKPSQSDDDKTDNSSTDKKEESATDKDEDSSTDKENKDETTDNNNDSVEDEQNETNNEQGNSAPEETDPYADLTSVQMAEAMKIGWNLGNTFDAPTETGWGMPKTTEAMIDAVAAAGFKTIRIPVSWSTHVTGENYSITSSWMERVKEVVDWAIKDEMIVILNVHHDNYSITEIGTKKGGFALSDDKDIQKKSKDYLASVWKQISTTFADYDNSLVFEVLNEPRDIGGKWKGNEWWTNNKSVIDVITDYEQTCIDAIRSVSGNKNRFVMVPGYAASGSDSGMLALYTMPTDTSDDKLMLSAHAYSPYAFAMYDSNDSNHTKFTAADKNSLDSIFKYLYDNYTKKGIGVVMGEASASDKNNTDQREAWATYYFQKAKAAGIPVVLWDNMVTMTNGGSLTSGECHGWLNRKTQTWFYPSIIENMMKATGITTYSIPEYKAPAPTTLDSIGWDASSAVKLSNETWSLDWSSDHFIAKQANAKEGSILKIVVGSSGTSFRMINSNWQYNYLEGSIVNGTAGSENINSTAKEVYYVLTASDAEKFKSDKIVFAGNSGTITAVYFQE